MGSAYFDLSVKWCDTSLRKKCTYSELFWSLFSSIRTEYGELRIQSECGKIQTRITPNTDIFHAVLITSWYIFEVRYWI